MRLLCLSDLHNDRAAAVRLAGVSSGARADAIVSAGDLASDGEHLPSLYSALRAPGLPVLCVPGNHDGAAPYAKALSESGWSDLQGRTLELAGWMFAGWGVHTDDALPSSDAERQHDDPVLSAVLAALGDVTSGRIVVVAHVPPRGTSCAIDRKGIDRGSVQLRAWIARAQPFAVVCGHVHHREVVLDRIGRTLVVNPGPHGHVLELP